MASAGCYGIAHQVYGGSLKVRGADGGMSAIALHFWVVAGNELIDFRARRWMIFQDPNIVPHGFFLPADYPSAHYEGRPAIGDWANAEIHQILLLIGTSHA
jgi:hypothetical protein